MTMIDGPAGPIEVKENGRGSPVVLIPSLGRGANDFDPLSGQLAAAGCHAMAPEPRGVGNSTGELSGLTMSDLAGDAAAVTEALAAEPVTIIGHAFGNRVSRMAVPENALRLCDELGDRASLVTVPNAGHALLPEHPDAPAGAVLDWLRQRNRISNPQG